MLVGFYFYILQQRRLLNNDNNVERVKITGNQYQTNQESQELQYSQVTNFKLQIRCKNCQMHLSCIYKYQMKQTTKKDEDIIIGLILLIEILQLLAILKGSHL